MLLIVFVYRSLAVLKAKLRAQGVNVDGLWDEIKQLVVKTLISVESQVITAAKMFVPHPENCYQPVAIFTAESREDTLFLRLGAPYFSHSHGLDVHSRALL